MNFALEIQNIANRIVNPMQVIASKGCKPQQEFLFDCSVLDEKYLTHDDITKSPEYEERFDRLKKLTGPVVYVFEMDSISKTTPKEIVDSIQAYSLSENARPVPAIKTNYPQTNILYVGKVKGKFYGRVIQHLGFHRDKGTQGLQLCYWAKRLNLKLKITAMEFENDAKDLIPIFENCLADKLKPILGKHK